MPVQPLQADYTTFIKGFVTEASPLTFPDNAAIIDTNFVLNIDGSRSRRTGMDFEHNYNLIPTNESGADANVAISSHIWTAVANRGDLEFAVVQVGTTLYFFSTKEGNISNNPVNRGLPVTIDGDRTVTISGTSIHGRFVIANGQQVVTILSYNVLTDTISAITKRITIRDLFGVIDNLAVNDKPTTLSLAHRYNLRNQGWPETFSTSNDSDGNGVSNRDPIAYTNEKLARYPSNSEIIWSAKLSSAKTPASVNSYSPWDLDKNSFGNTPAPKGSFIIDVFNRGQSRKDAGFTLTKFPGPTGDTELPLDQSSGGIIAVATFAGRVFYAIRESSFSNKDERAPNIGTMIFFSRASNAVEDWVKCHAEADPSSEHVFDPIATDGGFITVPEMGAVMNIKTMGQSLFVFSTNGVWEIHGGESPFSATNQEVMKTTNIGAVNRDCVIYAEDKICYWGRSGIYLITRDSLTLRGSNNDLTFKTIQSYFDDIDIASKENAIGTYDSYTRTFRWLFADNDNLNKRVYTNELIYDMKLGSFYLFDINYTTSTPWTCGYLTLSDTIYLTDFDNIQVGTDSIVSISDSVIISVRTPEEKSLGSTKYLTLVNDNGVLKFTFSHYRDYNFLDWYSYTNTGLDAEATLLTGYITGGSPNMEKEISYITTYFKCTESGFNPDGSVIDPSSCTMQTQWDWTNSVNQGRWSREFEAYRLPRLFMPIDETFNYGFSTIVTKNKLRGHGRALSILFKTKPGYNLHLYGWSIVGGGVIK